MNWLKRLAVLAVAGLSGLAGCGAGPLVACDEGQHEVIICTECGPTDECVSTETVCGPTCQTDDDCPGSTCDPDLRVCGVQRCG